MQLAQINLKNSGLTLESTLRPALLNLKPVRMVVQSVCGTELSLVLLRGESSHLEKPQAQQDLVFTAHVVFSTGNLICIICCQKLL